ncbi:hypothetical protein FQA39_LY03767 [Lamprigera yunnana]|nr:hypothetical protein FQA39_LY03767 [Lamprigera yunnana]
MNKKGFPIVWGRNGGGFRFAELKEDHFDEVVHIFKEHYIPNDVILKNLNMIEDKESMESFCSRLLLTLKNGSSIIAVSRSSQENIAAVLVLRTIDKFDYGRVTSRTKLVAGRCMKKFTKLKEHIYRQIDYYLKYNCERILRFYYLCVTPEYKHIGLGYQMMLTALSVARANGAGVVVGLFPTFKLQNLAENLGMKKQYEVKFSEWEEDGYPGFYARYVRKLCSYGNGNSVLK